MPRNSLPERNLMAEMTLKPLPYVDASTCPMAVTLTLITGKWKPALLHRLLAGPCQFLEMSRCFPQTSRKVLTEQLRELERDGLITRSPQRDARRTVVYALSSSGRALTPALQALYDWGRVYLPPPVA
jgi:DNA-binding HxlR family transcriptional regulator